MIYLFGLFKIINAAITPGTHPHTVRINTITTEPQPLPITASGGKRIAKRTLQILIQNKATINIFDFAEIKHPFGLLQRGNVTIPK